MFTKSNEKYMLYLRDEFYAEMEDYYKLEIVMPMIGDKKNKDYIPTPEDSKNNRIFLHFVLNEIPDMNGEQGKNFL